MVDDRTALMSARALTPGYEVLWYTIDRVLGQGGFGITYLAHDRNLNRSVAIKEYLPTSFAYRHEDYSVKPITGDHRDNFTWGLDSFLKEAQTLARFSHPNIVRVHTVFEENNTAYMVMEYEHGQNLAAIYKQSESLGQSFFEQVFFPIMDGLKEIHKFEFIHRDIKPANIYIREDGTPVLIDFGSARQTTQQQTNEMTILVSQGYTPLEQYSANYGDQGPWTDIYAMAATIYEGVVGKKPDESLSRSACLMRSKPDLLDRLDASLYSGFSQRFLNAVLKGLKLEPEGRPQSLEDWILQFQQGDNVMEPAIQGSGFTEMESDSTRIQPRPLRDSDSHSSRSTTSQPESTSARLATDQRPASNLLDFDDDDFVPVSSTMHGQRASATSARARSDDTGPKKRTGVIVTLMSVLLLCGAGGAYYLYGNKTAQSAITASVLNSMPPPPQSVATVLPKALVLAELNDMRALASLLAQAYELDASDPELLDTIDATEKNLLVLAKKWNATNHADIANSIRAVSDTLPSAVHDRGRIQGLLAASGMVSTYREVLALLDNEHYLEPAGSSVIDLIPSVSATDYIELKETAQWAKMMTEFSVVALDKLVESEFDDAARLTEAALTLEPDDAGFNALRKFLNAAQ